MPSFRLIPAVSLLALSLACSKAAPQASPGPVACFDASSDKTSPGTRAVFEARHCQGGGVTWGPILHALVERRGGTRGVAEVVPGFTGAVYTLNNGARFAIDDEADDARFCADSADLFAAVKADYDRVNADASQLQKVMGEASALAMECNEADGRAPEIPSAIRKMLEK